MTKKTVAARHGLALDDETVRALDFADADGILAVAERFYSTSSLNAGIVEALLSSLDDNFEKAGREDGETGPALSPRQKAFAKWAAFLMHETRRAERERRATCAEKGLPPPEEVKWEGKCTKLVAKHASEACSLLTVARPGAWHLGGGLFYHLRAALEGGLFYHEAMDVGLFNHMPPESVGSRPAK